MTGPQRLTVYGAPWCPDCRRAKQFLSEHRVDYRSHSHLVPQPSAP